MAGHSKWANIQHRKKAQDSKRGKLFTKLIREITVAARMGGGGDVETNPRLRLAVDKALVANMTRDTIDRAIKRGVGGGEDEHVEELTYEGYGPGGVAVMVECITNNRNRTVADVRHAFTKCGGNLGTDGSVNYLFNKRGILSYATGADENKIMEMAIEAGAEDVVVNEDGSIDVFTTPNDFGSVKTAMQAVKVEPINADIMLLANVEVAVDFENAEKLLRMTEMLEDHDDVQNVYTNASIASDILEKLA